ncbi:hypothetical protein KP509_06G043600 [Ceratopteris richardii]|uniref:Laccase n=1 Tax=Ceratopteris richardii TaxID=49495 RepID=A0A8T2US67_CERRI|nr:hypothetical protein KP509_06G043600 [Ceratopteris richardii]
MHSEIVVWWVFLLVLGSSSGSVFARTRYFNFTVQTTNVTRLCYTKALLTVNGQFPGPTSYVREGDRVVVNVTNLSSYDLTIHWHGVRQLLSCWADGPAFITQCPIKTNQSYVHRFRIVDQRGTLFWHAHQSWLRATIHGAFIILKKNKVGYPFEKPREELPPLIIGEWWNANTEDIIAQALVQGGGYNISDAITINGQPGDLYNCSSDGTVVYNVSQGDTILLRLINAGMNFHFFFAIANHNLTVVEADAEYTEPYQTDVVVLAPGQTTNVLLTANNSVGRYYMAVSVFSPPNITLVPYPNVSATAILAYDNVSAASSTPALPSFPAANDTSYVNNFFSSLRGQNYSRGFYYYKVPQKVDIDLLHTVGYSLQPCPSGQTCQGPNGTLIRSSISNITFVTPQLSILQAYYGNGNGNNSVYTTDFPDVPIFEYNYTGINLANKVALPGTRVRVIPFNSTVQVVYQDTATLFFESHPIHLHGQNFYIVGMGTGTFNASRDTPSFNLVNPVSRNTVSVPYGGWAAVRFQAVNPGINSTRSSQVSL